MHVFFKFSQLSSCVRDTASSDQIECQNNCSKNTSAHEVSALVRDVEVGVRLRAWNGWVCVCGQRLFLISRRRNAPLPSPSWRSPAGCVTQKCPSCQRCPQYQLGRWAPSHHREELPYVWSGCCCP